MSADLGVAFALRAVNERVQQAVARRPLVRKGTARGQWAAALRRGTPAWEWVVTVTQRALLEGRDLSAALALPQVAEPQKGSQGFPR